MVEAALLLEKDQADSSITSCAKRYHAEFMTSPKGNLRNTEPQGKAMPPAAEASITFEKQSMVC